MRTAWKRRSRLPTSRRPGCLRTPAAARTGLDPDGRVPMRGDVKADDNPHDVLRLAWAVALGYASPHIATIGPTARRGQRRRAGQPGY